MPAIACLSRLAVASVNTHRTRWPTPTPTQTRRVTYIYVLKCITHTTLPRTELPFSFRRLQPSLLSPATRLHGHRTSSLLSRWAGTYLPTYLPPSLNFAKAARHSRLYNIEAEVAGKFNEDFHRSRTAINRARRNVQLNSVRFLAVQRSISFTAERRWRPRGVARIISSKETYLLFATTELQRIYTSCTLV